MNLLVLLLLGVTLSVGITARAELTEISWPALKATLPLWTPDSPKPKAGWPAIVYYHGTSSRPSLIRFRAVAPSPPFVIVSMAYVQSGRFQQTEESITAELAQLTALKQRLVSEHQVDATRIYVAGFSKGGWFAALLLERDRSLAGGMVFGAGVFHGRHEAKVAPFQNHKSIYIGVGRQDNNYPQSLRALVHFRKLGAQVHLDPWPDTPHYYPKTAPGLNQWLELEAQKEAALPAARSWVGNRSQEIKAIADPVEKWYAWNAFLERPYVKALGKREAELAHAQIAALVKAEPLVAKELQWRDESRDIVRREMKDRYVTTLEKVHARYIDLAKRAKGTRAGEIAEQDAHRTEQLLEHADKSN